MELVAYMRLNYLEKIFNDFVELELDEYILRKPEKKDGKDVIEIYKNRKEPIFYRSPSSINEKYARVFIEELLEEYEKRERIDWVVIDKNSNKVIGLIGLFSIDSQDSRGEIGYILNDEYTNKGIMSHILKWFVYFCFTYINLHKLEVNINCKNIPSLKVAKNVGFIEEGLRKNYYFNRIEGIYDDVILMSIINEDWEIILERI
ncbi:GNAT family N-acetyltransferase [Clostridium intestinale]|uniref:Ribosomal-protein-amino-adicN-acetyltransferase n=1 Tax=Clostridium intestinale URNW TaxID=1294142 RepID=U2Q7R9_9CLOT|nr:GNAT family protein [Clostridium intestinale]ERK32214.1 ribosomal-protein-amino-adicN-acetyltransferase [Clostridium intestinale URNW]